MQFRDIHGLKKLLANKAFLTVAKWLLVALILVFIYVALRDEKQLGQKTWVQLKSTLASGRLFLFSIPILLAGVNWYLETVRWQALAGKIEKISLIHAFSSVLAGQSLSFITPQSIGDYLGRILHLNQHNRSEAIGAVMFGRWIQTLVTGMFGSIGLFYVLKVEFQMTSTVSLLIGILFLLFWGFILYLFLVKRNFLTDRLNSLIGEKWSRYIQIVGTYDKWDSLKIIVITIGRYIIFTVQFVTIFLVFEATAVTGHLLAGITWMFLLKSIVPAINIFADLSVRELAVVYFFKLYPEKIEIIILASFFLWVINILLPTLIGLFHVYRLKLVVK